MLYRHNCVPTMHEHPNIFQHWNINFFSFFFLYFSFYFVTKRENYDFRSLKSWFISSHNGFYGYLLPFSLCFLLHQIIFYFFLVFQFYFFRTNDNEVKLWFCHVQFKQTFHIFNFFFLSSTLKFFSFFVNFTLILCWCLWFNVRSCVVWTKIEVLQCKAYKLINFCLYESLSLWKVPGVCHEMRRKVNRNDTLLLEWIPTNNFPFICNIIHFIYSRFVALVSYEN